jgi:predicted DNA-binding transcriptional regulator AlpA
LKRKRGRPKKGPVAALDASLIADLDPLLTDEHLAELIDVNPVTIERWRRAGTFPPALMLPGGHKRTRASEYHAWTAARAADAERHALQRRAIMAEVRSRQTRGPRPIQHRARRPGV